MQLFIIVGAVLYVWNVSYQKKSGYEQRIETKSHNQRHQGGVKVKRILKDFSKIKLRMQSQFILIFIGPMQFLLSLIHSQRDTIHLNMPFMRFIVHVGDGQFSDILLEVVSPAPSITIIIGGGRGQRRENVPSRGV